MAALVVVGRGTAPVLGEEQGQAVAGAAQVRRLGEERQPADRVVQRGRASFTVGHRRPRLSARAVQAARPSKIRTLARSSWRATYGISPSQRSKITFSLLASRTMADTTLPSISSSITSPARSLIVVVFIVSRPLSGRPSPLVRARTVRGSYRCTCHIGTDRGRLYENFRVVGSGKTSGRPSLTLSANVAGRFSRKLSTPSRAS